MNQNGKYKAPNTDEPCPVVTTQGRLGLASVSFLSKAYSGHPESKNIPITGPAGSVTTIDHHQFVSAYYGNGFNRSVDEPSPTVSTKDRLLLVSPVSCKPWLMDTNFGNVGRSIDKPSPVITANRKWHYLMNPQFNNIGRELEKPCFTLIARMDKKPPYLITSVGGDCVIEVYPTDSPTMIKIKEFMTLYNLVDIKKRMLNIRELLQIQGFPKNYKLKGTKSEQKKYIGNSVEVKVARALRKSTVEGLNNLKLKSA